MDRFQTMQLFVRIVELGSFTKGAEDLELPRATATHAIQQLEKRLGTRLLQRTTRQVKPTPDGEAYYQRCVRLLADLDETESAFGQSAASPKGKLRVDLQETLARHYLLPHLGEFCARYPDIELEIGMGDRLVDLVREGVDCVLRAGTPRDSSMVLRHVADKPQFTCASPAYLAKYGVPESLDDLPRHRAVNYLSSATGRRVPFDFIVDGQPQSVLMKGSVAVRHADAYLACCLAGQGLIQIPRYHVEAAVNEGRLQEVLAPWCPAPMPVSLLYPHSRQLSPRVRVFVDWVIERMKDPGPAPNRASAPPRA